MKMEEMVFQIGPIRPPSEANSLLLRVTINCPWNKCKFCMLYKKYDFHTRPVEDVKKDIDTMAELRDRIKQYKTADGDWDIEAINKDYQTLTTDDQRWCYHMVFRWLTEGDSNSIFLQDANTMCLRPDWLAEIIRYVRVKLPEIKRITSYGRANTLAKISAEDYKMLKEFEIFSKNTAVFFHNKYKFEPAIMAFSERNLALKMILENCKNKVEYEDIYKEADKLLKRCAIETEASSQRNLCKETNNLLKTYMKRITKKNDYKEHTFSNGMRMVLTDKNIQDNKEFFNGLFKKITKKQKKRG